MAWYQAGRCGHRSRVQIYGTNVRGERKAEAARRAQQLCLACRRTARDAASADNAAAERWPELTGTEKQVRWAMPLRDTAVRALDRSMSEPRDCIADVATRAELYRSILLSATGAGSQIEHRGLVEHPVPDLIAVFADDRSRARLAQVAAAELAPILVAAAVEVSVEPEPADSTAKHWIEPASPEDGPVLVLPTNVERAYRVWEETRRILAEPWHVTRLRPALTDALAASTVPGHLLRVAVRAAAVAPAPITAPDRYRAANSLLDEYHRHTISTDRQPAAALEVCAESWWIKARVRVTRAVRCREHAFTAGQELEMIQFGLPGWPRIGDGWWATDPDTALDITNDLDEIAVIANDNIEVIEILAQSAP